MVKNNNDPNCFVLYLVFLRQILKDILNDKTAGLIESNFSPTTAKCIVDVIHDGWRIAIPSDLKDLLPNVTGIPVGNGLWDIFEQLTD